MEIRGSTHDSRASPSHGGIIQGERERKQCPALLLRWATVGGRQRESQVEAYYDSLFPFLKLHSDMRPQKYPARYEKTMGVRGGQ